RKLRRSQPTRRGCRGRRATRSRHSRAQLCAGSLLSGKQLQHVLEADERQSATTYYDHVSILKFIEKNWRLPKISSRSRDNLPNPVADDDNEYRPNNRPAIGDLMNLFAFEDVEDRDDDRDDNRR